MDMKVLIVIHDNHQENNIFPLGAAYIASSLLSIGVDVSTCCMDVFHQSNEELSELIKSNKFDMIFLGFMVPRFRRTVRELCLTINQARNNDCWFVLGGYGPSAIPEYILSETGADIACIGEGDEIVVNLVKAKLGECDISEIEGIAYLRKEKTIINKRAPKIKQLDQLAFPAWHLFPIDMYVKNLKFAGMQSNEKAFPIISSRGCTDQCSFCFRLESGVRSRSPENIIEEMKTLNDRYGITYFYFVDELAIVSKKQVLNLASKIREVLPDIKYRMDCRVTLFDDEIALALKDSGCTFLNIGFESSSQIVLDKMQKRATIEQNIKAVETAIKFDIGVGLNFIWGMPGDNEQTLIDDAEFIKKYNQYDQIRIIRPVTPYPGSPLYYKALSEGKLSGPDDFFEKFKNSDRYMVNFMDIKEADVYRLLLEVNADLIRDHFRNTDGDFAKAEKMISELKMLYKNAEYFYTGPSNSYFKLKYDGM